MNILEARNSLTNTSSLLNESDYLNVTGFVASELLTTKASVQTAQNILQKFTFSSDFGTKIKTAFGDNFNSTIVNTLAQAWAKGDFSSFPEIEIRSASEINGANGAFAASTNKIYLSREFVNRGDVETIASVLLEEYGHYIDSQINASDSAGDEGNIFAALAQGKVLSESELVDLKGEDDSAIVVLDGEMVRIEQAETTSQKDKLDFSAEKIGNWGGGGSNRLEENLFEPVEIPSAEQNSGGTIDNFFVKLDYDSKSELKGSVFVTPGNYGEAAFSYPINVTVELPKQVDLSETFSIIPGVGVKSSDAKFEKTKTKGFELPNAGIKIEANLLKAQLKDVTLKNPFGSPFKPDIQIDSSGAQATLSIDTIKYAPLGFNFPDGIGSIKGSVPKIEDGKINPTTPRDTTDPILSDIAASGRSNSFLEIEGDLDRIFALSFPALRVLGNEVEASLPQERIKAKLSYDLLDIKSKIGLGLQQDFTFDPDRVEVIMSVDGQPEQRGILGNQNNNFQFQAPSQGSGLLKVKAKYELFGNVKNNIGAVIQGGIDVSAFQFGGTFEVGKLSGSSQIGPFLSLKIPKDGFATDPLPLIGTPPTKPTDPDPEFKILKAVNTKEIGGTELDNKNPNPDATKNLIVELEYEIPYNLPFSISDARATEGNNLVFTVSRREPSNEAVNLILEYENGNATAGEDYFPGQRTVTIGAGQVSADITVPTTGDNKQESTETFKVKLKKPDGSSFATDDPVTTIDATGIIIDDDDKPQPPEKQGSTWGEPHLVTLDGVRYDFQAVGEFTLLKSTSGDLEIQTRQQPFRDEPISINTAIATKVEGRRVAFYRQQDRPQPLWIDGNPVEIPDLEYISFGNSRIYREGDTYTLVYPNGEQLVVDTRTGFKGIGYLDINLYLNKEREGQIVGLLGNNNGKRDDEIALRDGTVLKTPIAPKDLYGKYANSWRISQAESLFDYQPGEDTNTFTNTNFPIRSISINDLDPVKRQKAEQIALAAGITNPNILEAAIIDLVLSDFDESFLQGALQARIPEESLILAIPTQAFDDFTATLVNTPTKINVTSNDEATINLTKIISSFDQTSAKGGIIKLDDNGTPEDRTDDQLLYTPTANFTGEDSFNYTIFDGTITSSAKVTINIADLSLAKLDGSNGLLLNGIFPGSFSGVAVNKLGDFNGDGNNDLIVGAFGADPNNNNAAGESYIVFGKKGGFPASIDLPNLDGNNGFILNGADLNGFSGGTVSSAGDINNDGLDDLVIGAFAASANGQENAGKAYVVFGSKTPLPARFNLSQINGSNGFIIQGNNEFDYLGLAASGVGDINADGVDDLMVSSPGPLNGTTSKTYIIYGRKDGFPVLLNSTDINGTNGFVINDPDGKSGTSVSAAGDVNGDQISDLIINAEENDSNSYVIFGSASGFPANFNLSDLNGTNGFILDTGEEKFGTTVSQAGDINGDGIDDLIVALASTNSSAGKSYVIFGSNKGFASRINLSQLNGNNGFTILNNIDGNSISSVSGAGDVNGDGIDDLTIGVSQAFGNGKFAAGKTYLLFGNNGGFSSIFNLSRINGINGLVIHGINESDLSGTSLSSSGDINNDGLSDIIIGSPGNLFNNSPGTSQVVFGSALFGANNDASNLAKLLFNSGYYLSQNPDVQEAVDKGFFRNAFEHFVTIGFAEGRNPSSYFASDYLINNPDVAFAVANGIVRNGFTHFIKAGVIEGRSSDTLLSALDLLYRQENPDVNQAIQQGFFSSALEHLVFVGMNEGRRIFPEFQALAETFDSDYYLTENSDVKQAVESGIFPNALSHFVTLGLAEGRDPSSQFSNSEYLANYPDVAAVVSQGILRNGFEHFIKFGFGEARTGSLIF